MGRLRRRSRRMTTMDERNEARAFALLLEVRQNGVARPATQNDVLELTGTPRYLLKLSSGAYIAVDGARLTAAQREALVIPDRAVARRMCREGREKHVDVRVVRLCR